MFNKEYRRNKEVVTMYLTSVNGRAHRQRIQYQCRTAAQRENLPVTVTEQRELSVKNKAE